MIIVTGGAGFIGSNLVRALNTRGENDILIVDHLTEGKKFNNIVDCQIADYIDREDFLSELPKLSNSIQAIFHQGACSKTTEWNGQFMMKNNYEYSKALFHYCLAHRVPFIYASSAAVYGVGTIFEEHLDYERPLNVYGYSKFLFDQYIRRHLPNSSSPIIGLRYFNVYGPGEVHKGSMASVAFHLHQQILDQGVGRLFEGSDGYGPGEQLRDFVYVDDVVNINLWFLDHPKNGIYNVGTGKAESFNAVAKAVLAHHQRGKIEYIPFPEHLKGVYQSFTEANITRLRAAGYTASFKTVAEGVKAYLEKISTI